MTGDSRIRLLKIGVTRGDTFVSQAYFTTPSMVTIGRGEEAVIRLDHADVPSHAPLFSLEEGSCLLQFKRTMQLAFLYDGLFRTPNYLIDEGLAFRRGRNYYLNLETRARGTLNFGPFRILFKLDFVAAPREKTIPLPTLDQLANVTCAHCKQPMDMFLPKPGVMCRCRSCRRFNRFEGQPLVTSEAPPVRKDGTEYAPVLLENRVSGPPTAGLVEDALTVLDAGVMRPPTQTDPAAKSAPAPPTSLTGDGSTPPVREDSLEEPSPISEAAGDEPPAAADPEDTGVPGDDDPQGPLPAPPDVLAERDTATLKAEDGEQSKKARRKRIVTGDHLRVVASSQAAQQGAEVNQGETEGAWFEESRAANGGPVAGPKVVPLPLTSAPHGAPGLSSAPHSALPDRPPVGPDTPPVGSVTDSYAAAKLADRLTLLVVALVIIAILLACILGVLLTQGAMRRLAAPPAEATTDAPGYLAFPDDEDGDV